MAATQDATGPDDGGGGPIAWDPRVMLGKPVVRGTRITVELILERLGEGWTIADLLDAYPQLTEAGVRAALTFAARTLGMEAIYPLPAAPAPPEAPEAAG
jgi:uncharacterized protein (DUF433 family)